MSPAPPLAPGAVLVDEYRIEEHLARGETLDVYTVWSDRRGCRCVAKTLRPDRAADNAARTRLLREGELLHRLDHPHLIRGYESHSRPRPAVILETLTGETLSHLIASRHQGLATRDLLHLGLQLCSVIGYLHRSDTLHLDLKPSNVVIDAKRARLLDLSHARPPGRCPAGFGTTEYMPPEQLVGGQVSAASDSFGLGGVLYRAATRRRPYEATDRRDDPYRSPSVAPLRRRHLPAALVAMTSACLDPVATARPTISDIAGELAAALTKVSR